MIKNAFVFPVTGTVFGYKKKPPSPSPDGGS
jgi:hypothetical protein